MKPMTVDDSHAEDWRTLWEAGPESIKEQLRTRWGKSNQAAIVTHEPEDWRALWDAAPDDIKEEMRARWTDEQILPFGANRPLTAHDLREIIEIQKTSARRWIVELVVVLVAVYLLIRLIEFWRR